MREEFTLSIPNFEGPFDLLLQLISKHKLDITEVALSKVTDEFIAHLRAQQDQDWDLDQTSQFLVVAATLLDLKAARLLPQGEVEDAEDLALLEARDLLFARLMQYRAFKEVASWLNQKLQEEERYFPRPGALEAEYAKLLPEVVIPAGPSDLAWLAARALQPKAPTSVELEHLHAPKVSVREQAQFITDRLRQEKKLTFRSLISDTQEKIVVVARFLALLELYREALISFEQLTALGELSIHWIGKTELNSEVNDSEKASAVLDQEELND